MANETQNQFNRAIEKALLCTPPNMPDNTKYLPYKGSQRDFDRYIEDLAGAITVGYDWIINPETGKNFTTDDVDILLPLVGGDSLHGYWTSIPTDFFTSRPANSTYLFKGGNSTAQISVSSGTYDLNGSTVVMNAPGWQYFGGYNSIYGTPTTFTNGTFGPGTMVSFRWNWYGDRQMIIDVELDNAFALHISNSITYFKQKANLEQLSICGSGGDMAVINVDAPVEIGEISRGNSHTGTCTIDCTENGYIRIHKRHYLSDEDGTFVIKGSNPDHISLGWEDPQLGYYDCILGGSINIYKNMLVTNVVGTTGNITVTEFSDYWQASTPDQQFYYTGLRVHGSFPSGYTLQSGRDYGGTGDIGDQTFHPATT